MAATKSAETAESLRGVSPTSRLRARDRIDFRLQLSGVCNTKAPHAILNDHDNSIDKLKEVER